MPQLVAPEDRPDIQPQPPSSSVNMEALTKLAIWLAPAAALFLIIKFWQWLVFRICGEPRPRIVAILIFLTVAIPGMVFVVLYNIERAGSAATN